MSKSPRPLIAVVGILAVMLVAPSSATAGVGASAAPEFPITIRLGDTDVPAAIEIRNGNSDDPDPADPDQDTGYANTVCNEGDGFPCTPGQRGITLVPSCGLIGSGTTCDPTGADPGVFQLSPIATGSDACDGIDFTVAVIDPAIDMWQFTPTGGRNVTLPNAGAQCEINFTFDVVKLPTVDVNPNVAGVQTAQIVSTDQIVDVASDNHVVPAQGNGTSVRQILLAQPAIATTASSDTRLGAGDLMDTAVVSGRFDPETSGTIDFRLYGPDDDTCANTPVFESLGVAQPVAEGPVPSGSFTPTLLGTYRWTAAYSGDANNLSVAGACNDANETTVVDKALPTLVTEASAGAVVGTAVLTDTATVSGRAAPQASTIDFRLYGPDDDACSSAPVFESLGVAYPVAGGTVTSAAYTPATFGTYRWVATYSGDDNNESVTGTCGDATETATVTRAPSTLIATASDDAKIGDATLSATASLPTLVGPLPGGTVDFALYGTDDPTCSGPVVFETPDVPIGSAAITSGDFTPVAAGTYRWVTSYSGDDNNAPATTSCDEAGTSTVVALAMPTISVAASPLVTLGAGTINATTELEGLVQPRVGATVTFRLYGPDDDDCSGSPIFTAEPIDYPVAGGPVASPDFTPTEAGTYRWRAVYSGDTNNIGVTSSCALTGAAVAVTDIAVVELPATGATTWQIVTLAGTFLLLGAALRGSARRKSPNIG